MKDEDDNGDINEKQSISGNWYSSNSKKLKDNHVLSLMMIYELIKEVKNVKKI